MALIIGTGDELSEFCREINAGGLGEMDKGNLVKKIGEPLAILLPRETKSYNSIVERFVAHTDLGSQRLFG